MMENFKNQGYGDLFKSSPYSNQAKKEITPFSSNTNDITPKLANTFKPDTTIKPNYYAEYLRDYTPSGGSVFDTFTTDHETYKEDYGVQYLRRLLKPKETVAYENDLPDFTKTIRQNPEKRLLVADAGSAVFGSDLPKLIKNAGIFDYDSKLSQSTQYNLSVAVLQNELKYLGYYSGEVDGLFGPQTFKAVNKYKNDKGIPNTFLNQGVVDLWTWKSLGLTYRTKEDIAAGITIVTDGLKQHKDVSVPLNKALKSIVETAKNLNYKGVGIGRGIWFVMQVYHEQPWDIKVESVWNQTVARGTYPGFNAKVYYNGWLATPEELGNYTYGYIGTALGFDLGMLCGGSWVAAGFPMEGERLANEFKDHSAIKRGRYACIINEIMNWS